MTFFYSHSIYQPNQAQPSPIYIKNFMLENFHNGCCEIFPSYITYILGERVSLPTLRPFSTHCVNYSSYNWEDNFVKYIIFLSSQYILLWFIRLSRGSWSQDYR